MLEDGAASIAKRGAPISGYYFQIGTLNQVEAGFISTDMEVKEPILRISLVGSLRTCIEGSARAR
jgi:hypothetical protein